MWLSGKQFPKHSIINNFRSKRLKDHINKLFTQVVMMLVELGYITLDVQYIDGTKIESSAIKRSRFGIKICPYFSVCSPFKISNPRNNAFTCL